MVDLHRPDAVRILDFPHAVEHLLAPVPQVLGPASAATTAWREVWVPALKHGAPAVVPGARGDLPLEAAPDPAAATATRAAPLEYCGVLRPSLGAGAVSGLHRAGVADGQRLRGERAHGGGAGAPEGAGHALGTGEREAAAGVALGGLQ